METIRNTVLRAAPNYPCISRVGVFGSCARGDFDFNDDVDILYDYDYEAADATQQFLSFVEEFLVDLKPLDADFIFIDDLLKSNDVEFKKNVMKDIVWVYKGETK
ncbi:MAG: nucleotidyltransferase domain-containing protein [Defluviitaleaceae bacterium]|nr:nucleotidyltransferase domain-containing protein [Defluviitaleaceae bacterium]